VQVGLGGGLVDGQDGVDNGGSQPIGEGAVELGGERGLGDAEEELTINLLGQLEAIEELGGVR
jgi:hypothetical protein